MSTLQRLPIAAMAGVNRAQAPELIRDTEFADARNLDFSGKGGVALGAPGTFRLLSEKLPGAITSIASMSYKVIVSAGGGGYMFDLDDVAGKQAIEPTLIWSGKSPTGTPMCAQLRGYTFYVDGADGSRPWCVAPDGTVSDWGVSGAMGAPTCTPEFDYSQEGALTQDYIIIEGQTVWRIYYYKLAYAVEDPAGNLQMRGTLSDAHYIQAEFYNRKITLSGLTMGDSRATHLYIYRAYPNQSATFYYLGKVPRGVTVYEDNNPNTPCSSATHSLVGATYSAPEKADVITANAGCLWVGAIANSLTGAIQRDVFAWTYPGRPWDMPAAHRQAVPTAAGNIIAAARFRNMTLFLCEKEIVAVTGNMPSGANMIQIQEFTCRYPCVARKSVFWVDTPGAGELVGWLSATDVAVFNGSQVTAIGGPIRDVLADIPHENLMQAAAVTDSRRQVVHIYIPDSRQTSGVLRLDWFYANRLSDEPVWGLGDGLAVTAAAEVWGGTSGAFLLLGDSTGQLHLSTSGAYAWGATLWQHAGSDGYAIGGTISGVTAGNTAFSCSAAKPLYTSGSGLAGLSVSVKRQGTDVGTATIVSNSAASITIGSPISGMTTGDVFMVGAIDAWGKTKPYAVSPTRTAKRLHYVLTEEQNQGDTAGEKYWIALYRDTQEDDRLSVPMDSRTNKTGVIGRAHRVALKVRCLSNKARLDIRRLDLLYRESQEEEKTRSSATSAPSKPL